VITEELQYHYSRQMVCFRCIIVDTLHEGRLKKNK